METAERQRTPESGGLAIPAKGRLNLRTPRQGDGPEISALIAACPPLDRNSAYCNLLQCTHFAETCVIAQVDGKLAGWVSGYIPPGQDDTLFVWQVAVAETSRGLGLGRRMLTELLARKACKAVRRLTTTITPGNTASWALFSGLADSLNAEIDDAPWLIQGRHLPADHPSEHLVTIGPFPANGL